MQKWRPITINDPCPFYILLFFILSNKCNYVYRSHFIYFFRTANSYMSFPFTGQKIHFKTPTKLVYKLSTESEMWPVSFSVFPECFPFRQSFTSGGDPLSRADGRWVLGVLGKGTSEGTRVAEG